MFARFLEPVTDQVCESRQAPRIELGQAFVILIAKFAAHFAATQKRRIADDDIDDRPIRFGRIPLVVESQNRIFADDVVLQFFQNRLLERLPVTIVLTPLDVADPDDDACQGMSDGIDFDAVHLARVDFGRRHLQARPKRVLDDLFFQVHQHLQGDVEEVAAAAGRVEHGGAANPLQYALAQSQQLVPRIALRAAGLSRTS